MVKLPHPKPSGRAWTSFVADPPTPDKPERPTRGLHEQGNPKHRLRVEHDANTLLLHLADEDGAGWTTIAVDRATRQSAPGRGRRQIDSTRAAYEALYEA